MSMASPAILSNSLKNSELKTIHNTLRGCRVHLIYQTTFLKIAVYTASWELPTLYFEFNWKKNPLSQTCEDKHWQSNCQGIQWGSSFPYCAISISDFRCFKFYFFNVCCQIMKKKRRFNIKFLLQTSLQYFTEMYWNTVLLGFYFLEKEMRKPLISCLLYCEIMHLKAKRKFTLLVASNSDFVSANVTLNCTLDINLCHRWN